MSQTIAPQGPATRRGLPWWGWVLIALGVVALVAVPVLGMVAYVTHSIGETSPDQPFLEGAPQQPDATHPLECAYRCFELEAAEQLAISADDAASLSIHDELSGVGEIESSTVAEVAPDVGEQWLELGGDAECAFVTANAPYVGTGTGSTSDDPIGWVQVWQTGDEMVDIAARAFPTSTDASAFMRDLHERVASCPWQDLNVPAPGGLDSSLVQITAQAAIDVPDEVAAVGWVREGSPGPRWRSYVWDLQRGNLVVQVRVLTDGRISEQQVATFAELRAARLAGLEPAAP